MKFCGQYTAPLALICPKCHFQNPPGFKFCGQCTVALGPATAKPEPSGPSFKLRESDDAALEGERKTVTALFADIKGSTELEQDLDPEQARAIVESGSEADDRSGAPLRRLRRAIDGRRNLRAIRRADRQRGNAPAGGAQEDAVRLVETVCTTGELSDQEARQPIAFRWRYCRRALPVPSRRRPRLKLQLVSICDSEPRLSSAHCARFPCRGVFNSTGPVWIGLIRSIQFGRNTETRHLP